VQLHPIHLAIRGSRAIRRVDLGYHFLARPSRNPSAMAAPRSGPLALVHTLLRTTLTEARQALSSGTALGSLKTSRCGTPRVDALLSTAEDRCFSDR
jgi:hypothetical protein